MGDRVLFQICDGWALGADNLQWILFKADKRGPQAEKRHRRAPWKALAFIAYTKTVLLRVLSENGVEPTPEGRAALAALPDTFKAWRRQYNRASTSAPSDIERAA